MSACLNNIRLYSVLIMLLISVGCEQSAEDQEKPEVVHLYTSVPLKLVAEIKTYFEKTYPHITLEVNRAGTAKIMQRIDQEIAAGEIKADVIWLADFSNAEELKDKGLLQQYVSAENKKIFPLFKDPDGYYSGSRLLNMVIAYNTDYIKKKPVSYKDLLAAELNNRVGIVNPEISGSALYAISCLMLDQNYGQNYFKDLSNNGLEIVKNNSVLAQKIADGEISAGIIIDFSVRNLKQQQPDLPIDYVYPGKGTIVIASPIALTKASRAPVASKRFIDWVLSVNGQNLLSSQLGIAPVREDVKAPEGMISLSELFVFPASPKVINHNRDITLDIYRKLFNKVK